MEMTRRNFMAAAGVAAAAAVAAPVIANADQAAPAEEAPAEDAGAVRICISCNDLDRSRDFFCSQLEFTLVGEGILLEDVVEPLYGLRRECCRSRSRCRCWRRDAGSGAGLRHLPHRPCS